MEDEERAVLYRRTFDSEDGKQVLEDLCLTLYGKRSTFHPNPFEAARLAGFRDAWIHIQRLVETDLDELRRVREAIDARNRASRARERQFDE